MDTTEMLLQFMLQWVPDPSQASVIFAGSSVDSGGQSGHVMVGIMLNEGGWNAWPVDRQFLLRAENLEWLK